MNNTKPGPTAAPNDLVARADDYVRSLLPKADAVTQDGEYPLWHGWALNEAWREGYAQGRADTLRRERDRADAAEAEGLEQARLLGMSAERELALRTELAAAREDAERYRLARTHVFGIADWTEFAKPLIRYGINADERLDAARAEGEK